MRVLSLFSGGGLGDYGLELAGMEVVGQVEIDPYCQKILKLRWPNVPKWEDIRNVTGEEIYETCGKIDIISGGFPCQPFSVAGKQRGDKDDRHLWPEMFRIISEVRPAWVLGENVSGLVRLGLDQVLSDLESQGYACQAFIIPACAVDAPHRRDRVWIIAHSERVGREAGAKPDIRPQESEAQESEYFCTNPSGIGDVGYAKHDGQPAAKVRGSSAQRGDSNKTGEKQACESSRSGQQYEDVADSDSRRCSPIINTRGSTKEDCRGQDNPQSSCADVANPSEQRLEGATGEGLQRHSSRSPIKSRTESWMWPIEPAVGRVAHGIANRVDRLKLLGNGQQVQVVEWIGKRIMEFDNK